MGIVPTSANTVKRTPENPPFVPLRVTLSLISVTYGLVHAIEPRPLTLVPESEGPEALTLHAPAAAKATLLSAALLGSSLLGAAAIVKADTAIITPSTNSFRFIFFPFRFYLVLQS